MDKKLFAAIDLGGTKIYTVIADSRGVILADDRQATQAADGPEAVIEQLSASVRVILAKNNLHLSDVAAVGVCATGFFDWQRKVMVSSPNLPGWKDVALEKKLSTMLGVTVVAENDANAAALGEARFGAGQGSREIVYVTVSTGIGAGLIQDGRIYRGGRGFAGELGHMVVKPDGELCGCGRRGCLETVSSGTAIARAAIKAVQQGIPTVLQEKAKRELTAPDVFSAAAKGDAAAASILEEALFYLGVGLVNVVNLLNPQVIVIGGGVAEAGDAILRPLSETIAARAVPPAAASVVLRKAQLGVKAGVTGILCLLADR
jgi:glucokinase